MSDAFAPIYYTQDSEKKMKLDMNKCVLLLGIVLLTFSLSTKVKAYTLWDWEWRTSDIDPLYYYDYSSYFEYEVEMSYWEAKDIEPYFDEGDFQTSTLWLHETNNSEVEWDGLCEPTETTGSYFDRVDCTGNDYYLDPYGTYKRRSVLGHELGHALGLHHETGPVLMNPTTYYRYEYYGIEAPQDDDEDGVQAIYG